MPFNDKIESDINKMDLLEIIEKRLNTDNSELLRNYDADFKELHRPWQNASEYYEVNEVGKQINSEFSLLHLNAQSIRNKFDDILHLLENIKFHPNVIGITETHLKEHEIDAFDILTGYTFVHRSRKTLQKGGVGIYIDKNLRFRERTDLELALDEKIGTLSFMEIVYENKNNAIIGTIYKRDKKNFQQFLDILEEILTKILKENKKVYLMGDFNENLLEILTNQQTQTFLDCIFSKCLFPVISKPTRFCKTAATLLDVIFTNNIHTDYISGIIKDPISDHLPIYYIEYNKNTDSYHNEENQVKSTVEFKIINNNTVQKLLMELKRTDWTILNTITDINDKYNYFIGKITKLSDKYIPTKKITSKSKETTNTKQWLTKGIRKSCKTKRTLYFLSIKHPTKINIEKYRKYKNLLEKLKRKMKKHFYEKLFNDIRYDLKKTWSNINMILNKCKKKKRKTIETIVIDNSKETNKKIMADHFNEFFTSIGEKLAENIPVIDGSPIEFITNVNSDRSFYFFPTNNIEVKKIVMAIRDGTSIGHDGICNRFVKLIIEGIAEPLVHIINSSFQLGIVPDGLKIARIIPLFKAGDPCVPGNYRPISILPSISKVIEKIVANRLRHFLEKQKTLLPNQFGFRPRHSTELALQLLNDDLCKNIDSKLFTCGLCLDFSKAFDTVDHIILLNKMEKYGIRGKSLEWFSSYLKNRKQYVNLEKINSNLNTVKYGVPQGSILGPLLFLIYVNDMPQSSNRLKFLLFADDTTVYMSHGSINVLFDDMNSELSRLTYWLDLNKLTVNTDKTKYLIFASTPKLKIIKNKYCNEIRLKGKTIERVEKIKFLGVILQQNIKWHEHINVLAHKLRSTIAIINRLKHFVPSKILLSLYNSLILPHLNYCINVWGKTERYNSNRLLLLQKKGIRGIANIGYREHTNLLFREYKIMTLNQLYNFKISTIMYKYYNNQLPEAFENYLQPAEAIHRYPTRKKDTLRILQHSTAICESSLKISGPKIWNTLSESIKTRPSLKAFKKQLKKTYFSI